jgi:hypothetical protein
VFFSELAKQTLDLVTEGDEHFGGIGHRDNADEKHEDANDE